jgi:hypothetical protein
MDGEHDFGVVDIHGVEAGVGAGVGLMMQHGAHGAVSQDRLAGMQSLAECEFAHDVSAGDTGASLTAV